VRGGRLPKALDLELADLQVDDDEAATSVVVEEQSRKNS
jgi:hypothetical protein